MTPIPINLAVEDELSEAALRRILAHVNRGYSIGTTYRRGGFGYLRRTISGWNQAARGIPFVVLTDLDESPCPSALIEDWLTEPKHPNLLFRVAVREIEAWLLADQQHFAQYLRVSEALVPSNPDFLADPKEKLIQLAARSRFAAVRDRIVPRPRSTARQGPDYNACLVSFVATHWNIKSVH